ncbi:hypothetical protein [Liquorilactobacillus capillatus]|uniref:Prophage related protein n=1 Tax=Liquorilactobacillus capillatus DSM 19910 TaxID=1423731 RepID=A0A0R1M384_9LACO|nr:hypothetical protein [Liquorilactobacillus capillatus]KRL02493.1 prophage related protein [Liquorilactobacillus capillatus DSM 19910]
MAKKTIKGEDGKQYEVKEKKPFYKRVWFWLVVAVVVIIGFSQIGNSNNDTSSSAASGKATAHKTTKAEKGESSASADNGSKKITISYQDYDVANSKAYSTNFSDSNWAGTSVKVDKVTVYKLAKDYKYKSANDGTFQVNGFVRIHFTISPTRDISIYPTQGTAIYSNGEQHEADSDESWDGEISKGANKSGDVTIPVKSLSSVSSLKTIRYKFDANYDTDDYEDENSSHTYDFTLNLN